MLKSKESCPVRRIPACKAGLYGLTEDRELSESNSKPPFIPVHRIGHSGIFSKMGERKVSEIEKLLTRVCQDTEVLAVLLFGSAARDEQVPLSDVDICLVMRAKSFEPTDLSHKRLEYMKDNSLDVRIFQQLPLYIRVRVLKEGRILFVRDENQLYELAFRTARAFEDFKHIYYGYLKEVEVAG